VKHCHLSVPHVICWCRLHIISSCQQKQNKRCVFLVKSINEQKKLACTIFSKNLSPKYSLAKDHLLKIFFNSDDCFLVRQLFSYKVASIFHSFACIFSIKTYTRNSLLPVHRSFLVAFFLLTYYHRYKIHHSLTKFLVK
jgi:hypothetical protein